MDGILDVDQAHHAEALRERWGPLPDGGEGLEGNALGGEGARRVPRVDPGLLDVLHDPPDDHVSIHVRQRVNIQLRRALQVLVHQNGLIRVHRHGGVDVLPQVLLVVHDLHRPAAQNVRWADHHRVAQTSRGGHSLLLTPGDSAGGLVDPKPLEEGLKLLAVLCRVDRIRAGTPDPDVALAGRRGNGVLLEVLLKGLSQLQRGLPAKLYDDSLGPLCLEHVHNILDGEGLKVKAVRGVVVR
mmetsp:Transcript_1346/g.4700  ORF Transcript_1346/g.4700 Transcript_1346/m.4700 type:complete len:241 (+) Transcript_1346:2095-2817(+)